MQCTIAHTETVPQVINCNYGEKMYLVYTTVILFSILKMFPNSHLKLKAILTHA